MINDIRSGFKLSALLTATSIAATESATTSSIDLSAGTTGSIIVSAVAEDGAGSLTAVIEYSDDNTTFVTDDGSTGNGFSDVNSADAASPLALASGVAEAYMLNVVNPRGRYYRVALTAVGQSVEMSATGLVGPLRYVEPRT